MKTIKFDKLNEEIFYEKLSNGIDVYLYPFNKTKNFYISISTKYGSEVLEYKHKVSNKTYKVTPGCAHFLEHKVMNFTTNEKFFEEINKLGSLANAYTTYRVTNYNMWGSIDINKNIKLLFDMFFNPLITDKNVNEEKGIISEEIDMDKDDLSTNLYSKLNKNLFYELYPKNHILGEKEDINKITAKELNRLYKDFYNTNNLFVIVTGNFDKEIVSNYIEEYMGNIPKSNKFDIKVLKKKEKEKSKVFFEELKENIQNSEIMYGIKMTLKELDNYNIVKLGYYISILVNSKFSSTSPLYEEYKNNGLILNMSSGFRRVDNYLFMYFKATTADPNCLIERLDKDLKKFSIDKKTFERKKKKLISEMILNFESIEEVEYLLTKHIVEVGKPINNICTLINELNYEEIKEISKYLNNKSHSIVKASK